MDEFGWEEFFPEPSEEETLLTWAIMEGDVGATVVAASSFGSDLNKTMGEHTPLTLAAHVGNGDVVNLLLQQFKGAVDVNGRTLNGVTPLLSAANAGHTHICELLVAAGADVNLRGDGSYPLHNAIHFKHPQTALALLSLGADPQICDREGWHPLYYAATNGFTALCQELINRGCDVDFGRFVGGNEGSFYPLLSAIFQGHCQTAEYLIERGANVTLFDRTGRDAVCYAASGGHIRLLKLLLDSGGSKNLTKKWDTIHEVVHEPSAVEVLLDYGVDVDQLDGLGRTPLYIAAGGGFEETCKVLVRRGASVNSIRSYCTGSMMSSPLLKALHEGHVTVFDLLLDAGADPDFGRNCLLHALSLRHLDICATLLKRRLISPDFADFDGNSGLHVSTSCGFEPGTSLLLRFGANPNVVNVFGQIPLQLAVSGRQWAATAALLMAGAELKVEPSEARAKSSSSSVAKTTTTSTSSTTPTTTPTTTSTWDLKRQLAALIEEESEKEEGKNEAEKEEDDFESNSTRDETKKGDKSNQKTEEHDSRQGDDETGEGEGEEVREKEGEKEGGGGEREEREKGKEERRKRRSAVFWCQSYLNHPLPLMELSRISIRRHLGFALAEGRCHPDWDSFPTRLKNFIFLEKDEIC